MRKVIVMYHSVDGPNEPAVAGSFPLSMDRFIRQMEGAREKGWAFAPLSQLHEPVERDSLYITGDDGTVDWARNVLPWCEEQEIPTHTALVTGPWLEQPVYPVAHRVQIALATEGMDLPVPELTPEQVEYIDRAYHYETDPRRRYLKGACNLVLDHEDVLALLGPAGFDEQMLLSQRFAGPEEYRPYQFAEVGVHTVSHRALDGQPDRYVTEEILPCMATLMQHGLNVSRFYTSPMLPRYNATIQDLIEPLAAKGFTGVLSGLGVWDEVDFMIPRVDCIKVEEVLDLE